MQEMKTEDRILIEATRAFGSAGYEATSLDGLAQQLSVTKQAILYHFSSKDILFGAVIDESVDELAKVLDEAAGGKGIEAVEAIVGAVFRLAIRKPEILGILREVTRKGEPWNSRARDGLESLVKRAEDFLDAEMKAGRIRKCNVRLLLVSAYSTVMGVATEIEVLRAMGVEPTLKEAAIRRRELLGFLRSALK